MSQQPLSDQNLSATYSSLDSQQKQEFAFALPTPPDLQNVSAKTAYLADLRDKLGQIQGDVNEFLTRKMEDEKMKVQSANGGAAAGHLEHGKVKRDEEREEEMYGEEDPEDE